MCGEKAMASGEVIGMLGSPPHVRGKVDPVLLQVLHGGITPACAGKRCFCHPCSSHPWDHPRMCGEKGSLERSDTVMQGSPPHVRGKEPTQNPDDFIRGITPACAGKSSRHHLDGATGRDHPRMCGEKDISPSPPTPCLGSPPHVRGKAY